MPVGVASYVWQKQAKQPTEHAASNAQSADESPSVLSVQTPSNPLDLGQIPLGNGSSNTGSTSSGSTQSNELNPSTFKEYEKYKDSDSALFGDITKGTGPEAGANTTLIFVYQVWLTDGRLVDQSKKNEKGEYIPAQFKYGSDQIIKGLQEGIYGMKQGGSRLIIVPPKVGYGDKEYQGIPPNSVLVFEVTLVKVEQGS